MKSAHLLLLPLILLLSGLCYGDSSPVDNPVVNTTYGPVIGFVEDGVRMFFGIPYAASPTGNNRYRPPTAPAAWTEVRDATKHGDICPQIRFVGKLVIGNEDCLYINVHVPDNATSAKLLPVMMWIYGGGFVTGDGYGFGLYDAKNIVNKYNVVVVTLNYRLGPFGFMATYEMLEESGTTGNYGVLDQQFALNWVHDNIASFGGDPQSITIFGESAGAFSVCWHLVNPYNKGLFVAAIMESAACDGGETFQTMEVATNFNYLYASASGCNVSQFSQPGAFLECMRQLSTADTLTTLISQMFDPDWPEPNHFPGFNASLVTKMAPMIPWGPVIDGFATPDVPLRLMEKGQFNRVPLILGTNENEGSILIPPLTMIVRNITLPLNNASIVRAVEHLFNDTVAPVILSKYPLQDYNNSNDERMGHIMRDAFFVCGSRRAARTVSSFGVPTFLYHFTYHEDWIEYPILGDYHSAELEFVFDNQWPPGVHTFSARDKQMADTFGTYWTNLAKYGDPNGEGDVTWPPYSAQSEQNIFMDVPVSIQQQYNEQLCDFWDTISGME